MLMLIVIPTYKRNHCLRWVIQSLVQCRVESIHESIRVLIVNNYPPNAKEIKLIVDEFVGYKRFSWDILFRDRTLMPVDNWYSAILDNALPDEIVFINSDDDLFLPWSLEHRYREIVRLDADTLFAQTCTTVYFSMAGERALCEHEIIYSKEIQASLLNISSVQWFSPQHLSNHCYKNSNVFRAALTKALTWCHELDWLDYNNRTLFVTLFLPIALLLIDGKVAGLPLECIIRGRDVEEIVESKYGVPSWNHGFIHLCALNILNNKELKKFNEFDSLREIYSAVFVQYFFTYLFDRRVGVKKVLQTMRRTNVPLTRIFSLKVIYGLELIIKDLLKLRGMRLVRESRMHSIKTSDFLKEIERKYVLLRRS